MEVINLETLVAENNAYQTKALEAQEQCDALKTQAKKYKLKLATNCKLAYSQAQKSKDTHS